MQQGVVFKDLATKPTIYHIIIHAVLLYGDEMWIMKKTYSFKILVFKNKALRKLFGFTNGESHITGK